MLSIIVSWRDRPQLRQTLPALLAATRAVDGEVAVVDYGGDAEALAAQIAAAGGGGGNGGGVVVARVDGERYFNKARAQNIGAAHARHPILFFCDCDVIIEPAQIAELARELLESPGCFATLAGVTESVANARKAGFVTRFGYQLDLMLGNGRRLQILDHEEDAATGMRQAPGLLLVRREDFVAIDGYNGRLHGWGWEDQDMIARLTLGAGLSRRQRGTATHLSHGDDERMAHYPPAATRWESRDRMFRQALAFYDAGDLRGTFSADREQLVHRKLVSSPAATRAP